MILPKSFRKIEDELFQALYQVGGVERYVSNGGSSISQLIDMTAELKTSLHNMRLEMMLLKAELNLLKIKEEL